MSGSDSNVTVYSLYALVSIFILAIFAYFQYLAIDNQYFLFLTFSSYIFLAIGATLLFHAAAGHQPRKHRIFVNIIVLVFIAVILFTTFSLSDTPRGGIDHDYRISLKDFVITLEKGSWVEGEQVHYGYSSMHLETIFSADYPVGFIHVSEEWYYDIRVRCEEPVNLNGSIYTGLFLFTQPGKWLGFCHGTPREPIIIVNGTSNAVRIDSLMLNWGGTSPTYRVRTEGYEVKLMIALYFEEKADYGNKVNCTVYPNFDRGIIVWDYVVDSQLQNTAAILLCGAFAGILCYIPAMPIKTKLYEKITPIISRYSPKPETQPKETPKAFLKKCVKCGEEIPIASEECSYCNAKQKG